MMFFKEKKIHCLQQKFEHASFPGHANSYFFAFQLLFFSLLMLLILIAFIIALFVLSKPVFP